MVCDLCGNKPEEVRAKVEGVILNVCKTCGSYGEIVARPAPIRSTKPKTHRLPEEFIREDYAKIIRDKREQLGLKQEELGNKLAEKVSVIQHLETGQLEPSIKLAKKLERNLSIRLVERDSTDISPSTPKQSSVGLTIGDVIKVKK